MDPLTLALMLGGSVIGAGGNLLGGLLSSGDEGGIDINEMYRNLFNYQADPSYNAAQTQILAMLGQPDTTSTIQASPWAQVANTANSQGLFKEEDARDVRQAIAVAEAITAQMAAQGVTDPNQVWAAIDSRIRNDYGRNGNRVVNQLITAIGSGGFGGPQDLVGRQMSYAKQAAELQSQLDKVRPTVTAGRVAAMEQIIRILQDFPAYTKSDIERLSEVERQRSREGVLQAANVGGFNPAAGLSEIERDPNPIARAVSLLSGAQGLGTNALAALNSSLLDPVQAAQAQAQIGLNAALGSMSTAAQQAMTYAGLNAQSANQNSGALGSGVAAGLGGLGQGLSSLAMLDLLKGIGGQPGTGQNQSNNNNNGGNYSFGSYGGLFP